MATGTLTPSPVQTVLDANGAIVPGALINVYLAGTTTRVATYTDVGLTVANANPIVASSAGRYTAFLTPGASYSFVVTTAAGAAVWNQDNVSAVPATSVNLDVTGTAGEALTAGQPVYLSDGSASKSAGQWYKADSATVYSSILPEVGMVPSSIASAASGTIRLAGSVSGLSALVVGSTYYVGTAGAITATAPTNNRRILGVADTTSSLVLTANPAVPTVNVEQCQGRLTLTTATPVTTADVTGAATIYWTPYKGNRVAIYDGAAWSIRVFTELSLALGTLTNDLPYDVFVYDNAGTLTLELLAWTSKTARATALVLQDGVWAKTGALTRRYLGTFHTTATTTTEDSYAKRLLWNYYNRVPRGLRVLEATDSWNYTTATVRQANGSTANQVAVVIGVAEPVLTLAVNATASNGNAANTVSFVVGIGEDSTTTILTTVTGRHSHNLSASGVMQINAWLTTYPAIGYHFYAWLEYSTALGTTSWYGDAGGINIQSGIAGSLV